MVINQYLRCLFGHKKVTVDILRSSLIGSLNINCQWLCLTPQYDSCAYKFRFLFLNSLNVSCKKKQIHLNHRRDFWKKTPLVLSTFIFILGHVFSFSVFLCNLCWKSSCFSKKKDLYTTSLYLLLLLIILSQNMTTTLTAPSYVWRVMTARPELQHVIEVGITLYHGPLPSHNRNTITIYSQLLPTIFVFPETTKNCPN